MFLRNLLLDEQHELHNRSMHISGIFKDYQKANIEEEKANIDVSKEYGHLFLNLSSKTILHIQKMYDAFGENTIFGRSDAQSVTGLKPTRTSELIAKHIIRCENNRARNWSWKRKIQVLLEPGQR